MTTDNHGGDAAPIGPCNLARILQESLRSLEQVLRNLLRGAQLPPDAAVELGDVKRFIACAHEEARQLVALMDASVHAAAWNENLRGALPAVPDQQAGHAGTLPDQLGAVVDALGPLKVATSALIFAMKGRVSKAALLHAEWIERWLLLSDASMTRAVAAMSASGSAETPGMVDGVAEHRDPEGDPGDRHGTPSRQPARPRPTPGKRLL